MPCAGWSYTYNSRGLGPTAGFLTDLVLVAAEMAVIAALAITILVKIGSARYSAAVLSPASSPNHRLTDLTDAMIYGFTAFAGFEAAAALGEEARNSRRSVPASIVGIVVVTGRLGRNLLIPAAATGVFLFPLWGILFPGAYTLMNLLPFIAFGWLLIGAGIAGLLRARRPAVFQALGRRAAPDEASQPQMS